MYNIIYSNAHRSRNRTERKRGPSELNKITFRDEAINHDSCCAVAYDQHQL